MTGYFFSILCDSFGCNNFKGDIPFEKSDRPVCDVYVTREGGGVDLKKLTLHIDFEYCPPM